MMMNHKWKAEQPRTYWIKRGKIKIQIYCDFEASLNTSIPRHAGTLDLTEDINVMGFIFSLAGKWLEHLAHAIVD